MPKSTYHIDINAPKQKVWEVMLADPTYREWTAAFHEGSFYQGSWDEGSDIHFVAEDDGKLSGMASKVVKNTPYEYISLEHVGEVVDGQVDTTSEQVQQWRGAHENYLFSENNGVTTLEVELEGDNISPEITEMFDGMWPQALAKLKEIAER